MAYIHTYIPWQSTYITCFSDLYGRGEGRDYKPTNRLILQIPKFRLAFTTFFPS
jgi:hypothetical protein